MKKIVLLVLGLIMSGFVFADEIAPTTSAVADIQALEKSFGGKIGVYAIDTNSKTIVSYRANERFPVQSTLKLMGVAALLKQSEEGKISIHEKIHYTEKDLAAYPWHPITGKYVRQGMSLEDLGEAAVSYSDNPAMNLIILHLGGTEFINQFAQSIGNHSFNVKHLEGQLNSDPNNPEDSSTPKDMARSIRKIVLGNALSPASRSKLLSWLENDKTGNQRIRAGTPNGWIVADKTGSGDYGVANDVGVLWSPYCRPVVLSIYTNQPQKDAKRREDILASVTNIIFEQVVKKDACFNAPFVA
jgi:beta-lactamase class A